MLGGHFSAQGQYFSRLVSKKPSGDRFWPKADLVGQGALGQLLTLAV